MSQPSSNAELGMAAFIKFNEVFAGLAEVFDNHDGTFTVTIGERSLRMGFAVAVEIVPVPEEVNK